MISSKLPEIGTTIFTVMSQLAHDQQAINLGQGFPDFNPDPKLVEFVSRAMIEGHNQYPSMLGIPTLRQAIADKIRTLYGHAYNPDSEITITSGATEALMSSILCAVGVGDEVIVIEPCYDCYVPDIRLAGAIPVPVAMRAPTEADPYYRVDWQRVRDAVTSRTRLLILNFPHNPTGAVFTDQDLDCLEDIVRDTRILLISDEVYEHIVFDGVQHNSVARRPALVERSFLISSFGKTYHTTGWKIGYCCAPSVLTVELRRVHQFVVFTVPSPMQYGLAAYMADPQPYLQLAAFYQEKRDRLSKGLADSRFQMLPSPSTFFMLGSYRQISDLPEVEFAKWLTRTYGVAAIPVSALYLHPTARASNHALVRFCFAKNDSTLDCAIEKLCGV